MLLYLIKKVKCVSKHYYEREKNMALLLISDYISIGEELPKIMTVDVHF